ncbi:hypothetical protein D3C81_1455040 [compost metagenome]
MLGLGGIALGQAHFGQAIEHLGLARRNALGALQAGSGAIEVATALLLLGSGQQRQHRPVQLLIGGQVAVAAGSAVSTGDASRLGRRCH